MSRERALELLQAGSSFLVTCHRRPDADALGSALGFARYLRSVGKDAQVFVPEPIALTLRFLPEPGEIIHALSADARFDSTWVMDTAAAVLLPIGLPEPALRGPLVVVDHHAAHDDVGDVVVRDITASSTGEVIFHLLRAAGMRELTEPVATPLYAALVADTGGFRYPVTNAAVLRLGADLVEAGADPWRVAYNLFEGWEPERLHLLAAVLDTLETHHEGRLSTLRVSREMLREVGANDDMVEGMVNYGRMLAGVEVAALVWEWPVRREDGSEALEVKVSLRSRGAVDVALIAVELGGGGHKAAAGAQVRGDLDGVLARIIELSGEHLR